MRIKYVISVGVKGHTISMAITYAIPVQDFQRRIGMTKKYGLVKIIDDGILPDGTHVDGAVSMYAGEVLTEGGE